MTLYNGYTKVKVHITSFDLCIDRFLSAANAAETVSLLEVCMILCKQSSAPKSTMVIWLGSENNKMQTKWIIFVFCKHDF